MIEDALSGIIAAAAADIDSVCINLDLAIPEIRSRCLKMDFSQLSALLMNEQ